MVFGTHELNLLMHRQTFVKRYEYLLCIESMSSVLMQLNKNTKLDVMFN